MAGQRNEKDAQSFLSLMKSKNYYLVEKKRNLKCRADCQQTNLNNDEDILGKIASSSLGQDFDNLFFSTSQDKSIDDFINGNSRQTASQNISLSVDDCDILQEVNQLDTQIVFTQTRLCNFPNSLTSINCGLSGLVAMPSLTIQSNDPPKTSPLRPDSERISSAFKNSNSCTFENQLRTEQISSHGCSSKHDGFAYHYGKGPTDEKTFDLLLQFAETHSHQFSNGDNFEPSPI